jgi:hypothetical protein
MHGGRGYKDPRFLDLGTNLRWVVSSTLLPLYPRRRANRHSLDKRIVGFQSWSGRYGELNILDPTGTRTPTLGSSSLLPVAIYDCATANHTALCARVCIYIYIYIYMYRKRERERNLDSAVSVETGYRIDDTAVGYRACGPRGASPPAIKLVTHLQLMSISRKRGSLHPLPLTPSWCSA